MKIIDLLNKIANGEEVPNKIKAGGYIWKYEKNFSQYKNNDFQELIKYLHGDYDGTGLIYPTIFNYEVELIEEQQDIEIQEIEKIKTYCNIIENTENEKVLFRMIQNNANKIDELVEAVKQLDRKIKE